MGAVATVAAGDKVFAHGKTDATMTVVSVHRNGKVAKVTKACGGTTFKNVRDLKVAA